MRIEECLANPVFTWKMDNKIAHSVTYRWSVNVRVNRITARAVCELCREILSTISSTTW